MSDDTHEVKIQKALAILRRWAKSLSVPVDMMASESLIHLWGIDTATDLLAHVWDAGKANTTRTFVEHDAWLKTQPEDL